MSTDSIVAGACCAVTRAACSPPGGSGASSVYSAEPLVCLAPARCGSDCPTTRTPPALAASVSTGAVMHDVATSGEATSASSPG